MKNFRTKAGAVLTSRWSGIIVAGVGIGTALAYLLMRNSSREKRGLPADLVLQHHIVDDHGTDQYAALRLLQNLRDRGFDSSDEKFALALGRPVEEVSAWSTGQLVIDDDAVMKARGIAILRGVNIE